MREGTLAFRVVKCLVGVRCCSGMPKKLVSLASDAKRPLEIVPDTLRKVVSKCKSSIFRSSIGLD